MSERAAPSHVTLDANEAVASVAYRLNDLVAIYPITPSSPMAENCDEWAAGGRTNLWGRIPRVVQLQSEGGVAGTVHGGLQAGALTTTFTASQGLLLMLPNLYKIAGELLPLTLHVSARAVATHALSIFGDHSDVMAARQTGCTLLNSGSVQEAQDLALVAHDVALRSRVPVIHFFDGFRTSHEVARIARLSDDDLRTVIDEASITAFRERAMNPDRPDIRGTAQNPDTYFQGREAVNPFVARVPSLVQASMDRVASRTGRAYHLFDYHGASDAERVIVVMGSAAETCEAVADHFNAHGAKLGVVRVRLFQPFDATAFVAALPPSTRAIAVLDRTKEPGALGEPLYLSVVAALHRLRSPLAGSPRVVGGRYGLGSKEFTPAMARAVFDELASSEPKHGFTVGIVDDVTHTSLPVDAEFDLEPEGVVRCVFFGLGADGTVGANKNSIKIIGEETGHYAQGYFVYDSKKSGAMTISHLRFGPSPIRAPYLIREADFVACSQFSFVGRHDMLRYARPGATILLNSPYGAAATWRELPLEWQETIIARKLRLFVIDASRVARDSGMRNRTNTVMQTCFFALSGVLPREEAIEQIKKSVRKTYGRKGEEIVKMNFAAIDSALAALEQVPIPQSPDAAARPTPPVVYPGAPDFFQRTTAALLAGRGDLLPVSAFPPDGVWPTGTARWEKRNLAAEIPVWDPSLCIQCNKCVLVCPHAAVRAKFYEPGVLQAAPDSFQSAPFRSQGQSAQRFTIQVAPEDCTGCSLCSVVCPAKDKTNPRHKALDMAPQEPRLATERLNFDFFLRIPDPDRTKLRVDVKGSQFMRPLFEFSGACSGCGETPYIKLLTQLFGDRLLIANATGCSSIYGGNLPTTPYATDAAGRGPAWANSLFEDNAEFGLGIKLAVDHRRAVARELLRRLGPLLGDDLARGLLEPDDYSEAGIAAQRRLVAVLRERLSGLLEPSARELASRADDLVRKTVWIVGGDGWAYDIGYGGLDHVLASGLDVKVLVLDTEVYSNTGGQSSKATPLGAVAKFASGGKEAAKKDLALLAMQYGHIYVARIAFGAKDTQTVQALREADAFPGPALVIAYSHCIAHGYTLHLGLDQQRLAVESGYWPLFRYDPRAPEGESPLRLDSGPPRTELAKFTANETRFRMLENIFPERARELAERAQAEVRRHYALYQSLAQPPATQPATTPAPSPAT